MADPYRSARHRARAAVRALVLAAAIASLSVLSVGCSNVKELSYTPVRMDPDPARTKTKEVSSSLLEMTGVQGKVTEPGPTVTRCREYGDDLFSLSHPWSVYGITDEQVDTGMAALRTQLVANGWKITKDGKANSTAQSPEIYAENDSQGFAMVVTGRKQSATGGPMLLFKVISHCYRAESAAALDGEY
ncbi:hypothetical protein [Streptomyces sp. NRRL F-2664]|uniref:hypothetical protein n=1 Tax=Streptomyces sp. NRRL F-2664 TaxID=1463842 RepID=UPI00131BECAC|nr:hypothetical protein [Streptomyces sp. NRRL F-2664]